jgi:hypothetical protein
MKAQPYHIVRHSKIHGKGVFARRPIRKGAKVIEYTGKIISNEEADEIGINDMDGHLHTMFFTVDDKRVIDGREGGDARFINHSCAPNCETVQEGDRIFIKALRSIAEGEELSYDYHLVVPGKITKKELRDYICLCGLPNCRGTQIAEEKIKRQLKKKHGKKLKKALDALQRERREAAAAASGTPAKAESPKAAKKSDKTPPMEKPAKVKKEKKETKEKKEIREKKADVKAARKPAKEKKQKKAAK